MNGVLTNYYTPKKTAIGAIKTSITNAQTTFNTASTGYNDRIGAVGASFTAIVNTL
jgi:hypothetical protein